MDISEALDPDFLSHLRMTEQDNLAEAEARVAKIRDNLGKLDLLLSMTSAVSAPAPAPAPVVAAWQKPKNERAIMPPAMGPLVIPPLKPRRGRPASPDKPITIGAYLLAKGLSLSDSGRIKGSFGGRLKAYAKRAGREVSYEWVKGQKYGGDGTPEELRRIRWTEKDRDLLDYVFDLHYAHLVQTTY